MSKLNSQKTNTLYLGLAGTGKSSRLAEDAIMALSEDKNILYLLPEEKSKKVFIQKHPSLRKNAHSFDSLSFHDFYLSETIYALEEYEINPENVKEYFNSTELNVKSPLHEDLALEITVWWLKNNQTSSFKNIDYIYIDDLQNLDGYMIVMLHFLFKNNTGVKIIAAGDPYQDAFPCREKNDPNKLFKEFEKWFGSTNVVEFNSNYRLSPTIQKFCNGFYEKKYKSISSYYENLFTYDKFFNLKNYTSEQYTEDVFIHSIQHRRDIINIIRDIIDLYPNKKISILGNFFMFIEYPELKQLDDDKIHISPIFNYYEESEIVILLYNFKTKITTLSEKNTINRIITRAKEKLHIIGSIPQKIVLSKFKSDTYTLIDVESFVVK